MTPPRLVAELVPSSTWGWNLRSELTGKGWDAIRKATYDLAKNVCEVCGGVGSKHPVECHERWLYDDRKKVQRLIGLEALCPSCHEVRHIGRAMTVGRGGDAFIHMARINGWTLEEVKAHVDAAMKVWQNRSRFPWNLDLSWLGDLPPEYIKKS